MKKIILGLSLILLSGNLFAQQCKSNLSDYEQFVVYNMSIVADLPEQISIMTKEYCANPMVKFEDNPPPAYIVKNVEELNAFMSNGVDYGSLASNDGFPYIIPYQLYANFKFYGASKNDDLGAIINKVNFPLKTQEAIFSRFSKNVNHKAVILKIIDIMPDYIWGETDNRGLSSLGYLTFFREKEAIQKIINRNSLAAKIKDEGIYPVAFNIFLTNCFIDKKKTQKTDAEIVSSLIDNGFNPIADKITFLSVDINFIDAVALFTPENQFMISMLKQKGYGKNWAAAQVNAMHLKEIFPKYLGYQPSFDEQRRTDPYSSLGSYNSCIQMGKK